MFCLGLGRSESILGMFNKDELYKLGSVAFVIIHTLAGSVTFAALNWLFQNGVLAQVVPDQTLGSESSLINSNAEINGIPSTLIEGGAKRGANLFHSFEKFSVEEGRGAYFNNPAGIQRILSRVTGNSISEILGTLGVLGNADLFIPMALFWVLKRPLISTVHFLRPPLLA